MKIINLVSICALMLTACKGNAVDLNMIFGTWKISEVFCSSCTDTESADRNINIRLKPDYAFNPIAGGECPGVTSFRKLPKTSSSYITVKEKVKPSWIVENDSFELLSYTCDEIDFMLFMIISEDSLVYIDEGDVVYRLSKI